MKLETVVEIVFNLRIEKGVSDKYNQMRESFNSTIHCTTSLGNLSSTRVN